MSSRFERRSRAARPFALTALAVVAGSLGGIAGSLLTDRYLTGMTWTIIVGGLLLALLAVPIVRARRCPNCDRQMGREVGIFCPVCGARLSSRDRDMIPSENDRERR
ncbi:MAG: hypothetical protein R6V85_21085 [Polyangia bacterium]